MVRLLTLAPLFAYMFRVFAEKQDKEAFLDAMIRIAFTKCSSDCAETSEVLNVGTSP